MYCFIVCSALCGITNHTYFQFNLNIEVVATSCNSFDSVVHQDFLQIPCLNYYYLLLLSMGLIRFEVIIFFLTIILGQGQSCGPLLDLVWFPPYPPEPIHGGIGSWMSSVSAVRKAKLCKADALKSGVKKIICSGVLDISRAPEALIYQSWGL